MMEKFSYYFEITVIVPQSYTHVTCVYIVTNTDTEYCLIVKEIPFKQIGEKARDRYNQTSSQKDTLIT